MRAGGDRRGNNRDRRRRKLWLLASFDTDLGPDAARCHLMVSDRCLGILDYATVTTDRITLGGDVRARELPSLLLAMPVATGRDGDARTVGDRMSLLVNPITAVVHRPSCVHAAASIPWEGFARASSDRPCRICRPEVPEPESEDA